MLRVFNCITVEHDLRLVLLAGAVCFAGCWIVIRMFLRARASEGLMRFGWLVMTAVAAGTSIWTTHFVAMLAFQPSLSSAFDPVFTVVSLADRGRRLLCRVCDRILAEPAARRRNRRRICRPRHRRHALHGNERVQRIRPHGMGRDVRRGFRYLRNPAGVACAQSRGAPGYRLIANTSRSAFSRSEFASCISPAWRQ